MDTPMGSNMRRALVRYLTILSSNRNRQRGTIVLVVLSSLK